MPKKSFQIIFCYTYLYELETIFRMKRNLTEILNQIFILIIEKRLF